MKKLLMIALSIGAIPAVAVGQIVTCDGCNHAVSVYMGEGGLIATAAEGAEKVIFVTTCGGVTRAGELIPNDGGVVAMLFARHNDLACHETGDDMGSFELGPIMDGGWYWINDTRNSALGSLVSKDVLKNDTITLTSAGASVTMTAGRGAVHLKESSSGRVGILPNILPKSPCGYAGGGTAADPFTRLTSACALGDGGTVLLATVRNPLTGTVRRLSNGGNLIRPNDTHVRTVTIDLWGNGSGHFFSSGTSAAANGADFTRGHAAVARSALRATQRLQGVTYTARLGSGPTGPDLAPGSPRGGITFNDAGDSSATVAIARDTDHCSTKNNHTATVTVTATMAAADNTGAAQVTPSVKRAPNTNVASGISFNVVCAAASSANQGTELVPENPFPVD